MEFDTNFFKENPTFHPSSLLENHSKPQMENGFSILSFSPKGLYQNFPNFDQSSIQGSSSSNSSFGVLTPFYDPFDPFQALSANEFASHSHLNAFSPFGSNGANQSMHGIQNTEFPNYPPRILLEALNQDQAFQSMNYREFGSMNGNLLDEVSCLTMEEGHETKIKKKKNVQPKESNKALQKPIFVKGQWTPEEDRLLVELVKEHGEKRWSHIAQMLNGRIGKQCRERWHNHLRPDIKKDTWSEEEEIMLIEAHKQIGNKWAAIARAMPGRTENTIKNHWNATKRRRLVTRRKGKCSSLLQEYIKSLTSDTSAADDDHLGSPLSDSSDMPVFYKMPQAQLQAENSGVEHKNDQKFPMYDSDMAVDNPPLGAKMTPPPQGYGFGSNMLNDIMSCGGSVVDDRNVGDKGMNFDGKDIEFLEMLYRGIT